MTWLICPVRPGDNNDELRFALRSWESNLLLTGGLSLLVVGYRPSWLRPDMFVAGNPTSSGPHNVLHNVLLASAAVPEPGVEAYYMNDDFFCLDPLPGVVQMRRNLTLDEHIGSLGSATAHWWGLSLIETARYLREYGVQNPLSYEIHRPMKAYPSAMKSVIETYFVDKETETPDAPAQWRTLYGNLVEIPEQSTPVRDVKYGGRRTPQQVGYGTPWVSTSDNNWRLHGIEIRKRFQKPSRWEI